jgi:hypothetical protein
MRETPTILAKVSGLTFSESRNRRKRRSGTTPENTVRTTPFFGYTCA